MKRQTCATPMIGDQVSKYSRCTSVLKCDASQNTYDGSNACTSIACITAAVLLRSEDVPANIRAYHTIMRNGAKIWNEWKDQQRSDQRNQSWKEVRSFKPSLFKTMRTFNECNGFINKQPTKYQKRCFLYKTVADVIDDLSYADRYLKYRSSAEQFNQWCEAEGTSQDQVIEIIDNVTSFRLRLQNGWDNPQRGGFDTDHNYRTPGDFSINKQDACRKRIPLGAKWNPFDYSESRVERIACVCTVGLFTFTIAHDTSGYYWFDSHAPEGVLKYYTSSDAIIQDIISKYSPDCEFTSVFLALDCVS